jgi:FKBP-type peptidyl-prolyl cis-trans isomerase
MSSRKLRSERARARRQRRRMQQGALIVIVLVVIALLVFILYDPGDGGGTSLNLSDAEVVTTASGLQYQDDVVGSGPAVQMGDRVSVHYTGWLTDGTKFDSSLDRGAPFDFQVGVDSVIQGWQEGLVGMQAGGVRILTIPGDLAYGPQGRPPTIPANATLVFQIELLEIK